MAKQNAYSIFVNDVARRRQQRGETNVNRAALFKKLDEEWREMPDEVKQIYKNIAKDGISSRSQQDKFTCDTYINKCPSSMPSKIENNPYNSRDNDVNCKLEIKVDDEDRKPSINTDSGVKREHDFEQRSLVEYQHDSKRLRIGIPNKRNIDSGHIQDVNRYSQYNLLKLRNHCESIVRSREKKLLKTPIYGFSTNVMCKYVRDGQEIFVPLEIGIYAYSMEGGKVRDPYHVLIDAGDVPHGCRSKSDIHSSNHRITYPPKDYPTAARKDYHKIYREMIDFVRNGERTILVNEARDIHQVKGCLEWLYLNAKKVDASVPGVSTWTILPAIDFIAAMYNFVYQRMLNNPTPLFALHYLLRITLEDSLMDYNASIMCDYHASLEEQTKWCALACAYKIFMNASSMLDDIYKMYKAAVDFKQNQRTDIQLAITEPKKLPAIEDAPPKLRSDQ